jgi:hypothetical protein
MNKGARTGEDGVKELLQELALLRARVDDVTEQFSLGVKARIDEIRHAMTSEGTPDAGHVLPEPRLVEKMVRRLRLLSRRQPKGRAKDLKRIQDLVTSLSEAVLSRE